MPENGPSGNLPSRFEVTTISAGVNSPVQVTIRDTETGATASASDYSFLVARAKAMQRLRPEDDPHAI